MPSSDLLSSYLTVRSARQSDLHAMEWEGELTHFRRLFADIYHRTERGSAAIWIAEWLGVGLIGQMFVQFDSARTELADGHTRAYVYGFRVRPAYRNLGVGTRMMEIAEANLLQRKFKIVVLNVAQDNPAARRLYERLNYRVVGTDPGLWHYLDERGIRREVNEPAWRMEKSLV